MRRLAILFGVGMGVAAGVDVACVPATEELLPRGAAGVRLEPSPAARGEPFVTGDGFTVRFERLALMGAARAQSPDRFGGIAESTWVCDGARSVESYVPGLPLATYGIEFGLWGRFVGLDVPDRDGIVVAPGHTVDPAVVARFGRLADNSPAGDPLYPEAFAEGPFIVFEARAVKGGDTFALALALGSLTTSWASSRPPEGVVTVRANEVVYSVQQATPERIFANGFERFAAADADGDRRITAAELGAVIVEEDGDGGTDAGRADTDAGDDLDGLRGCIGPGDGRPSPSDFRPRCRTLLDVVAEAASRIIVAPDAPPSATP